MRIAFLTGLFLFAIGALVAERYGLPNFVTTQTDKGFDQVELWVMGKDLPQPDFQAAAADVVIFDDPAAAGSSSPAIVPFMPTSAADNSHLALNEDGLDIIKTSRGLSLSPVEREDGWHIGYGHIMQEVPTQNITVVEAEKLLLADLQDAKASIHRQVAVPLNENEYSALVSFVESVGPETFVQTDVYRHLQSGKREAAAMAMQQHTMAQVNGETRQMPSLMERRQRETALFLRGE